MSGNSFDLCSEERRASKSSLHTHILQNQLTFIICLALFKLTLRIAVLAYSAVANILLKVCLTDQATAPIPL